jgi:hypothetical protein
MSAERPPPKSAKKARRSDGTKKRGGRPRLWVPGLVYVDDEGAIQRGRHAGYNGWGEDFRASPCGHFGTVAEWRHRAWLVERSQLTPALIDEHAIVLPELLLDAEAQPNARRWLAEQPLLCVSGLKQDRLGAAGIRVYTVEHGVDDDELFRVTASGGASKPWELRGRVSDFWPGGASNDEEPASLEGLSRGERYDARVTIDRVLSFVSRGVLREIAVVNALASYTLLEPGYGYRGATDGTPATLEHVQRELEPLEALFAAIYERAQGERRDADALISALERADERDSEVTVPVYGTARRERLGELSIALGSDGDGPRWRTGERQQEVLTLPEASRWVVSDVDAWSPTLDAELRERLERRQAQPNPTLPSWATSVLVGVLVVIAIACWWQLR